MKCITKKVCIVVGAVAAYIGGAIAVGMTWGGPEAGMFVCFGAPVFILGLGVTLGVMQSIEDGDICNYRNT